PWIATLVGTPVFEMPPWRKLGLIDPIVTPRPICMGFALEPPTDWLTRSEKLTSLSLNASVLMLARLFPTTSSACWLALKPEKLVEKEISIHTFLDVGFRLNSHAVVAGVVAGMAVDVAGTAGRLI